MPHPTVSKRIFHVQLWNRFARKANNKTQSLNRGQYSASEDFILAFVGTFRCCFQGI